MAKRPSAGSEIKAQPKKSAVPRQAAAPSQAPKPKTVPKKTVTVKAAPEKAKKPAAVPAKPVKQAPAAAAKSGQKAPAAVAKPVKQASAAAPKVHNKPKAAAPAAVPKPVPPLSIQFMMDLAKAIKESVEASARAVKGREVVDTAVSGDVTFQLDKTAEKTLLNFLKRAGKPVAYYSEDSGYATFTSEKPKYLLIVDPIDGSRAARSGFEGCVVSVASTRVIERPTMADLDSAVVLELLGDRSFQAERGKGVKIHAGSQSRRAKLSANETLESLTWSMTVPARPAELIFPTAARLIDCSSLKGGFFACNSTAYSLTRLLTNQLDACLDFANRYYRDMPERLQGLFERAGCGKVIGIAPYDLAAALLIAQEAGCTVTNAYGKGFDDVLLLDSSPSNHLSLVAAANAKLHAKLMDFLQKRIQQVEALLKR